MGTGQVHGTGRMAHATQGVGPGETVGTPSMAKEEERRAARTSPLLDTSHGPSTSNAHPNMQQDPSPTNTMQTPKKQQATCPPGPFTRSQSNTPPARPLECQGDGPPNATTNLPDTGQIATRRGKTQAPTNHRPFQAHAGDSADGPSYDGSLRPTSPPSSSTRPHLSVPDPWWNASC